MVASIAIPLAPSVRAIIDSRQRREEDDFVFGRRQGRPFTGFGVCKCVLDRRLEASGSQLGRWTLHDLRRTLATRMAELGVAPHIIESILNHVSGTKAGVAGVYNRATYEPQKRIALERWADHVVSLATGERPTTVVTLRRA